MAVPATTVTAVSQQILDAGDVPCLYTDSADPASTSLYAALGHRPVVDMVDLVVGHPALPGSDAHPRLADDE